MAAVTVLAYVMPAQLRLFQAINRACCKRIRVSRRIRQRRSRIEKLFSEATRLP
jgi:hypothetical protein